MYEMHHLKADVDRLYVKSKEGGRVPLPFEVVCKAEIINIAEYLKTKYKQRFVDDVKRHEINRPNLNSTIKTAAKLV
jgi:hypothetical protein